MEMWNANGLTENEKNIRIVSIIFPYSNIIHEASKHVNNIQKTKTKKIGPEFGENNEEIYCKL